MANIKNPWSPLFHRSKKK